MDLSVLEDVPEDVEKHIPMMVAHFSHDELNDLDKMQGGVSIDEATGLREYSKLWDIVKQPKMKSMFKKIAHVEKTQKEPEKSAFKGLEKIYPSSKQEFQPNPADDIPEVAAVEAAGTEGDDELALMPVPFLDFLDSLRGKPATNRTTGLPQYGFFKSLFRVGASIVGAMFGGPVGGAIAGGLSHKVTGGKFGRGALLGGIGGPMALYGAGQLGGMFPSLAGTVGSGASSLFGPTIGGHIGNIFNPVGGGVSGMLGGMLGGGAGTVGPQAAVGASQIASAAAPAAAGAASATAAPSFFSKLMEPGNLLPLATIGGLMYKGEKKAQQDMGDAIRRHQEANAALQTGSGMNMKLGNVKSFPTIYNPDFRTAKEKRGPMGSIEHEYFKPPPADYYMQYAKGGKASVPSDRGLAKMKELPANDHSHAIEGPGRGQEDRIPFQLKDGDYIIDASSVADLGDGSSKAGYDTINEMVHKLKSKFREPKVSYSRGGKIQDLSKSKNIPAALSDGEYKIDRKIVTIIGNGSNDIGADILDAARKNLRAHKNSNGNGLPPKAKHIFEYFPKQFKLKVG